MTAPDELIVLCARSHARVAIDVLRTMGLSPASLVDDDAALHGTEVDGVKVTGALDSVFNRKPETVKLVHGLGNKARAGNSDLRRRREWFERFKAQGYSFVQVISPKAMVSERAVLQEGCHVMTGAIVQAGCHVGANTIVNTGAQLDHDCRVGPHSHIAPGAILCGGVEVGAECHIGAGAVILENIKIGDRAVVGAGAVVTADVAAGTTVMGGAARVASNT